MDGSRTAWALPSCRSVCRVVRQHQMLGARAENFHSKRVASRDAKPSAVPACRTRALRGPRSRIAAICPTTALSSLD